MFFRKASLQLMESNPDAEGNSPHSRGEAVTPVSFLAILLIHGHTSALLPLRQGQGVINTTSRSAQGLGVFSGGNSGSA